MQGFPSSQSMIGPAAQAPSAHWSPTEHASPSLQGATFGRWMQPASGVHESSVQTSPSLQFTAVPGRQKPPPHLSLTVQALLSSQASVFGAWRQPSCASQESSVQTLPSLQSIPSPAAQVPPTQTSPRVQALLSLQGWLLGVWAQPVVGLQESSVHTFPSLQSRDAPGWQTPPQQTSLRVQAFPSLQEAVLSVWRQPPPGSQESSVQGFPSSQSTTESPTQAPSTQVSPRVHAFPSVQGTSLKAWRQPASGVQKSVVQTFPSSQSAVSS